MTCRPGDPALHILRTPCRMHGPHRESLKLPLLWAP